MVYTLSKQGHGDLLMFTDAGFAIPSGVEVIVLSLVVNKPMVLGSTCNTKKVLFC